MRAVVEHIPDRNFASMIRQLRRLHSFMGLTAVAGTSLVASIESVIAVLNDANDTIAALEDS